MHRKLLTLSKDVKEICEPYFKKLRLDHFNYIYRDSNGYVTYLCSNQRWLDHYLKNSYHKIGAFEQNNDLVKFKYILWNGLDRNDPILIDSKDMLEVEFGITIIKKENDGWEFYNLGARSSCSSIINSYINNLENYENFILDFKEKTQEITNSARRIKFSAEKEDFLTKSKGNHKFHLTSREFQCIRYLSLGKTAEEISIILNISKRTVETHIQNLKKKFKCYNQFRLGYLIGSRGIGEL